MNVSLRASPSVALYSKILMYDKSMGMKGKIIKLDF